MKAIKRSFLFGFLIGSTLLSLLFSSSTFAHVSLSESRPAKGEVLSAPPAEFSLIFSGEVRVVKVVLKKQPTGNPVDVSFAPPKQWATTFSWPSDVLPPSSYQFEWVVVGKDGHKMKGSYEFSIQ